MTLRSREVYCAWFLIRGLGSSIYSESDETRVKALVKSRRDMVKWIGIWFVCRAFLAYVEYFGTLTYVTYI